jgi:hypothetical protein
MESNLQRFNKDFQLKFGEGYVVGIPHNRVSSASHCEFTGKFSAAELNDRYLHGECIDIDAMDFSQVNAIHMDIGYVFRRC